MPRRLSNSVAFFALVAFATLSSFFIYHKFVKSWSSSSSDSSADFRIPARTIDDEWSPSDRTSLVHAKGGSRTKQQRAQISSTDGNSLSNSREKTSLSDTMTTSPNKQNTANEKRLGGDVPSTIESKGGLHTCTCLTNDDPRNANLPDTPKRIRWLHIPKTGTSFISTLWAYITTTSDRYIDLSISSHVCNNWDNTAYSMYDFSLMKRYPWEIYGAPNMIQPTPSKPFTKDSPLGLVGGTQHGPLTPDVKNSQFTSSKRYKRVRAKIKQWGSEITDHNLTIATFFRQPESRIISAYYDGRHASGLPPPIWKELTDATVQKRQKHQCIIDGTIQTTNPLECFANFPGIAGCMSRMLTGETCADGIAQLSGMDNVRDAIDIIMNHLDFVGLMEDWNESICQFHRLFMGKEHDDGDGTRRQWYAPLQGEFSNMHKSTKKKTFDIEHLHGFNDVADTVLYEAVKLKFKQMVGEERCYRYMTWDELKEQKMSSFIKLDDDGDVCQPKSCADLGKQCGEWDDGCGKTIICGMCNPGRTGLPSTWRVKCMEGQCIDYCPPWEERGYWFETAEDESSKDASFLTNKQEFFSTNKYVKQALGERNQKYLSPVEAVQICKIACRSESDEDVKSSDIPVGFAPFVDTGLCKCGSPPIMLSRNLTLEDFSMAHDLNTMCSDSRARKHAVLSVKETQPICCPYIEQITKQPPGGWKRLFTMGSSNLEGEYFAHVPLECGTFSECESIGRERQAEMAVLDVLNSMCYLARNVVKLGSFYTVTKSNQDRYVIDLR